jgi:hypothetical protein
VRKKRETVMDIGEWSSEQLSPLRKKRTNTGIKKWNPRKRTLLGNGGTLKKIL